MERCICIHGHFYQPPRENPWLETIEVQDSAYPYHDWNERITAECYEPNAASRILDPQGRIVKIVNNFASISFNFGPTLLSWLAEHQPHVYGRILQADRESQRRFAGHGSALAQVYNHMIMPLANRRDKLTQVRWGIRDFQYRFGRKPEGMWLAETAVDLETLDIMAQQGIKFTILAPNQASEVRKFRGRTWHDVSGSRIDPTLPYEVRLPSKRKMHLFFYDGPISRAVAFEGLLLKGENLAGRLLSGFAEHRDWPQLIHIATDGESYGHHHRHGDMALAYALHHIAEHKLARITNYGQYLHENPHSGEAKIFENSSWSCVHGVERWRSDCGCNSGGYPNWNQAWRGPLRAALDWLRDEVAPLYEQNAGELLNDPWRARNHYIDLVLDRSEKSVQRFFARHALRPLNPEEITTALKLLELQRNAMLMYTSCGWFFDEVSGIETVQVIAYAGRVVELAEQLFGRPLQEEFRRRLSAAKSNLPEHQDAGRIYEQAVQPAKVDPIKVGAHVAVSSLFEEYRDGIELFCYSVRLDDFRVHPAGRAKLAVGHGHFTSQVTRETAHLDFGVVHFGDHNLHGGIRPYQGEADYQQFVGQVVQLFQQADFPEVVSLLNREFAASTYSLRSLFRDEQRKILELILDSGPAERLYRELHQQQVPLAAFLASLDAPPPRAFRMAAEYIINVDLRRALKEEPDVERVAGLLDEARTWKVELDRGGLAMALEVKMTQTVDELKGTPDLQALERLDELALVASQLPFEVNVRSAQDLFWHWQQAVYPQMRAKADEGQQAARAWIDRFRTLGQRLSVYVE